ncbi:MAG: hypothetical protein S4CHLAM7_13010 [Chlamydiae bacterium]|nr:hypothetical protein [Chlamydiota bacterium]
MTLFNRETQAIFWNNNPKAIQRMLDYDYLCGRDTPSISAIVQPSKPSSFQKFFMGAKEVLIPLYTSTQEAVEKHPDTAVLLNFASFRSAYDVTKEALKFPSLKTLMITAEGIPERFARELALEAKNQGKVVIGPASVGAITPGGFKTGNVGGTISNILNAKLHRPGSCGVVTKSGGLFNELANIISLRTDGMAEGLAIGGDRFPGSSYIDHLLRMENNPAIKYMIVLGEVGGLAEYEIVEAVTKGLIKKPVIAWCIGTVANHFNQSIQFGHAGASAKKDIETAEAKNKAMRKAGIHVPKTFNHLPEVIEAIYKDLHAEGIIQETSEEEVPNIPEDYKTAQKTGKVRKATNFICTISDDRGEEAVYAGYPISSLATPETGFSIGDVLTLLWFKKRFPRWAVEFIETVIKTVADHGPAVSGAHNSRVTARAGKDLVSSLVTGLLTIGPKFGGAIDGAAKYFKNALSKEQDPKEFVEEMKKTNTPIPGIGHRVKSIRNPDLRVSCLKRFAYDSFPSTSLLDYALRVEQITTAKKENLILNVDGVIGVLMVDMWRNLNYSEDDINEFIDVGVLNAFFVIGRSIGFVGHILDEKRLNMPLYRHQTDDILYDIKKAENIIPEHLNDF